MTSREIYGFIGFYIEKVRPHDKPQFRGVFKQISTMLNEGITPEVIWQALKNYADHPCEPHFRKHIRSFFTKDTIVLWSDATQHKGKAAPVLARLDAQTLKLPVIAKRAVAQIEEEETDDSSF